MREGCASRSERSAALRFFAIDTQLLGVVLGSGPRGIVLAHGSNGDFCEWLPYARELAAGGYRVLAYTSRSGLRVDLDMAAAIEALRRTGSEHVVAMGSSAGAIAALIGSASLPTFFAASDGDEPFFTDAGALYAASASADKRLDILPGGMHGSAMLQVPAFRARVEAFIASH